MMGLIAAVNADAADDGSGQQLWSHDGEIVLPPGETTTLRIAMPDGEFGRDYVLRFRARVDLSRASGWGAGLLTVTHDGNLVGRLDEFGRRRLINKPPMIDAIDEQIRARHPRPWFGSDGGLCIFYAPSFDPLAEDNGFRPSSGKPFEFALLMTDRLLMGRTHEVELRYNLVGGKKLSEYTGEPSNMIIDHVQLVAIERQATGRTHVREVFGEAPTWDDGRTPRASIDKWGGVSIVLGDQQVAHLAARFSRPGGGFNHLGGDTDWSIAVAADRAVATDEKYRIERSVRAHEGYIDVEDTIVNTSDELLGFIVDWSATLADEQNVEKRLAGRAVEESKSRGYLTRSNPTVMARNADMTIGLVQLDDAMRAIGALAASGPSIGFYTERLGISARDSHTLRTRLFLLPPQADYWDFINAARRSLGANYLVRGPARFFSPNDYVPRNNPARMTDEQRRAWVNDPGLEIAMTYGPVDCEDLPDDAPLDASSGQKRMIGYSLVLLDFKAFVYHFRRAAELLRDAGDHDDLQIFAYMHTGICAIPNGPQRYPDNRVTRDDGSQYDNDYYDHYYDQAHLDEGYHTRYFYPYPGTAYQHDLLAMVGDYYFDTLGVDGIYWDEMQQQSWDWTFDRWDGVSVELDPQTYAVKRKLGELRLITNDALVEILQLIKSRGGQVLVNSPPATHAVASMRLLHMTETGRKPGPVTSPSDNTANVHLTTPIALGAMLAVTAEEVFSDIRRNLTGGCLYYYYNGRGVRATEHMFPITPQWIGPGCVIGADRIVTVRTGRYRWPAAKHGDSYTTLIYAAPDGQPDSPMAIFCEQDGYLNIAVPRDAMVVVLAAGRMRPPTGSGGRSR
jgi:hypothetical protein